MNKDLKKIIKTQVSQTLEKVIKKNKIRSKENSAASKLSQSKSPQSKPSKQST